MRSMKFLLASAVLLAAAFVAPAAQAQISVRIGGGGYGPPVCEYGYYGYAPYGCAPVGYYGPGYFYNGIFLGVGPWGGWGYDHGWGDHRFEGARGGSYTGGYGWQAHQRYSSGVRPGAGYRGGGARAAYAGNRGGGAARSSGAARGGFGGGGHGGGHGGGGHAGGGHGGGGGHH
jgi:hypothetical protein